MRSFLSVAALVAALVSVSASTPAQTRLLRHGETTRGQLIAGTSVDVTVDAGSGDFVLGSIRTSGRGMFVDLVSDKGAHVRRLAEPGASEQQFMFLRPSAGARLRLRAEDAPQDYTLTLDQVVAPAAQEPPPPGFLSHRIAKLAAHIAAGGSTDDFWRAAAASGTPLVEEPAGKPDTRIVTFLWRGAKRNVRLFGGPSNDHDWMLRLADSDVWYRSYEVPATTRLAYKLAPDVPDIPGTEHERRRALLATAQADPLNKKPWPEDAPDVYNQESVLELPNAPAEPWLADRKAPKGVLERHRFASKILHNERDIYTYVSHGFEPTNPEHALLLLFDAEPYLKKVPTLSIIDNLIADGKIAPLVVVLIGNPSAQTRARELPCNYDFARFLVTELQPWLVATTGVKPRAARTIVGGSSYGGLASACVAHAHPEIFGNVLSISGSFWWSSEAQEPEWLTRQFARDPPSTIRFFLSAGSFETGRDGSGILEATRHLRNVLVAKEFAVVHREYAATHDHIAWRAALADGLIALLRPHQDGASWPSSAPGPERASSNLQR